MAFTLLAMMLSGCVIPPSLEIDNQDAGTNSPPIITAVRTDVDQVREPGPMKIVKSSAGAGSLSVEVVDTDLSDTLFVWLYINYTIEVPTARLVGCEGAPGTVRRDCSIALDGVCLPEYIAADPEDLPLLSVKVFDRPLLTSGGDPPFQAMSKLDGLTSGLTFLLDCDEAAE